MTPCQRCSDAQVVVPDLNKYCNVLQNTGETAERMLREWVTHSLTNYGALQGIFLSACRHLIDRDHHRQHFLELAARYKIECVRAVINDINSTKQDRDSTFANVFILAFDEVSNVNLPI